MRLQRRDTRRQSQDSGSAQACRKAVEQYEKHIARERPTCPTLTRRRRCCYKVFQSPKKLDGATLLRCSPGASRNCRGRAPKQRKRCERLKHVLNDLQSFRWLSTVRLRSSGGRRCRRRKHLQVSGDAIQRRLGDRRGGLHATRGARSASDSPPMYQCKRTGWVSAGASTSTYAAQKILLTTPSRETCSRREAVSTGPSAHINGKQTHFKRAWGGCTSLPRLLLAISQSRRIGRILAKRLRRHARKTPTNLLPPPRARRKESLQTFCGDDLQRCLGRQRTAPNLHLSPPPCDLRERCWRPPNCAREPANLARKARVSWLWTQG